MESVQWRKQVFVDHFANIGLAFICLLPSRAVGSKAMSGLHADGEAGQQMSGTRMHHMVEERQRCLSFPFTALTSAGNKP